jgi:hypothetical protein
MDTPKGDMARAQDWRTRVMEIVRTLIKEADPQAIEEIKWRKPSNPSGVPVWSDHGIICTGETYMHKVKLTFAKGALLGDPAGLFNASLDGKLRRAIDISEDDSLDKGAFAELIRSAAALNRESDRD